MTSVVDIWYLSISMIQCV